MVTRNSIEMKGLKFTYRGIYVIERRLFFLSGNNNGFRPNWSIRFSPNIAKNIEIHVKGINTFSGS